MSKTLRGLSLPVLALLLAVAGGASSYADDKMAPAADAMAPAADAMAPAADAMAPAADAMAPMAPMSDEDLTKCMDQTAMITFPDVMMAAQGACKAMKDGTLHDMMTKMMAPGGAMGAMAPADAMAPAADAMAPAADAMAPAK